VNQQIKIIKILSRKVVVIIHRPESAEQTATSERGDCRVPAEQGTAAERAAADHTITLAN